MAYAEEVEEISCPSCGTPHRVTYVHSDFGSGREATASCASCKQPLAARSCFAIRAEPIDTSAARRPSS